MNSLYSSWNDCDVFLEDLNLIDQNLKNLVVKLQRVLVNVFVLDVFVICWEYMTSDYS